MKVYTVEFITKKGGNQNWRFGCEAANAKEAKEHAKAAWEARYNTAAPHMFDITVKKAESGVLFAFIKL